MKTAEEAGVKPANVLTEALAGAEIVITMLRKGSQVLTVWSDIIRSPAKDTLLIDCSTIDVDSARKAHAMAKQAGCLSLDAPVSGGTGGAAAATLTFMVGGSEESLPGPVPCFRRWARRLSTAATAVPARPRRSATT